MQKRQNFISDVLICSLCLEAQAKRSSNKNKTKCKRGKTSFRSYFDFPRFWASICFLFYFRCKCKRGKSCICEMISKCSKSNKNKKNAQVKIRTTPIVMVMIKSKGRCWVLEEAKVAQRPCFPFCLFWSWACCSHSKGRFWGTGNRAQVELNPCLPRCWVKAKANLAHRAKGRSWGTQSEGQKAKVLFYLLVRD